MSELNLSDVLTQKLNDLIPENKDNTEETLRKIERVKRNIDIYQHYHGLNGRDRLSLDGTGKLFGLTRESIRQITDKITQSLTIKKVDIPQLKSAVALVNSLVPSCANKLEKALVESGLTPAGFKVEGVVRAANLFGYDLKADRFINVNNVRFLIQDRFENTPKNILSLATKSISHNGAVNAQVLSKEISGVHQDIKFEFVKSILDTVETTVWIDEKWVHFGEKGINRLIERFNKIFSVNNSVYFNTLYLGISRNLKKGFKKDFTIMLPKDVMMNLISGLDSYSLNSDGVIKCDKPKDISVLTQVEHEMFMVLKNSEGNQLREKALEDLVVGDNPGKKYNFSQVLNFTPIIYNKERGLYSTLGIPRE